MSDKKDLSKIVSSLTDTINLLASYLSAEDEEEIEVMDEPADRFTMPEDDEIEIIDDEDDGEEVEDDEEIEIEDDEEEDKKAEAEKKPVKEDLETGKELAKYQEFVDYDMKEYGHISKRTLHFLAKAGLEVVKDEYGDYEVVAKEDDGITEGKCKSCKESKISTDESILNPIEPFQKAATGFVGKLLGEDEDEDAIFDVEIDECNLTETDEEDESYDSEEDAEVVITEENEGVDAKELATVINNFFKESGKADSEKTELAQKIIDIVPENLIDDLVAKAKEVFADKEIDYKMDREFSKKNIDSAPFDTIGELLDDPEINKLGKEIALTILGIVAIFEPSPVGELLVGVLSLLPADKFVQLMLQINFPVLGLVNMFRKKNKEAEVEEGLLGDIVTGVKKIFNPMSEECDECSECNESYLPYFEDRFGFIVSIGLADDLFYGDNYIIIDHNEDNDFNLGREIVFVDEEQMIHLYDEAKEEDIYTHFVNDGGETEHEIKVIFKQYINVDFVSNISIGTGRYMI